MNLKEIVTAVDSGKTVHWCTPRFRVVLDRSVGRYYIRGGLTNAPLTNGGYLVAHEAEFFIA
jgi:hypothetical protein